ncbi:MAG: DUF2012 domain-containing protein [Bacteroidota bacterium]
MWLQSVVRRCVRQINDSKLSLWFQSYTRVLANYGQHIGLIRGDGSFVINNVPPGSYIVEVASRDYIFEPFRVDITSKGKMRGRKLNFLQPNAVAQVRFMRARLARR